MNSLNDSVNRLAEYVNGLTARLNARAEWVERHADHESEQFAIEADLHDRFGHQPTAYESTFNPDDTEPQTSDVLTAQRFNDLCVVALSALFIATGDTQ